MTRQMESFAVSVGSEGMIKLSQLDMSGEDSIIVLHYSQMDLVVVWLEEAAKEAKKAAAE